MKRKSRKKDNFQERKEHKRKKMIGTWFCASRLNAVIRLIHALRPFKFVLCDSL